ncbi:hypothetical protein PCANC_27798 [Puccinia coronata f. sp. avenae]|uniref:Uncharacterized protein n=1 Tax=Puccinia coronata f. sp. avenae TaxID=200324 RepID=A0A2N5TZ13_9BASI|nr:hypothetical protein PCANC_27798 [Puccinia coronata f. sp. avenae]
MKPRMPVCMQNLMQLKSSLWSSQQIRLVGIPSSFMLLFGGCGGVVSIHNNPNLIFSQALIAFGGYRRQEAIILLRKFYITENTNAPVPKKKTGRMLKLEIPDF